MASYSVFTKPWLDRPAPELIDIVRGMGYDAIEFPLRDSAQVTPAEAERKLPQLVEALRAGGIRVDDVASVPEERVFAACRASGIPMIRVMFMPPEGNDYIEEEAKYLRQVDSWVPLCEAYGVKVGIQMHYGTGVSNTAEMMRAVRHLIAKGYRGTWCMPAEYTGLSQQQEAECARRDLIWLKSLVEA